MRTGARIAACLLLGALSRSAPALSDSPFPMRDNRFEIPIRVDETRRNDIKALELYVSTDQGKTWQKLPGPVKANPIEIDGHRIAAPVGSQLYVSPDGGQTWEKFGEAMPFKANGLVWCTRTRSIYAWRSTESRAENVIIRLDMPWPG